MTITMPGRFTLGAAVALLALTALFLAVVATSTGSVQGNEQQCEYDVILMEQVCTSSDGETTLSNTPTPEPTEEVGFARWMPVPDVLHDGTLRPTKVANVIPPIPPIKDFKYTISTATPKPRVRTATPTPKPRVRTLRQTRDVQVQQTIRQLVGNNLQTDNTNQLGWTVDRAQAFTTGSNSAGYKLTSVQLGINVGTTNLSGYAVEIANASGSAPGSTTVGTLNTLGTLSQGLNDFTAAGTGIDLAANTTYFIVVDVTTTNTAIRLKDTIGNGENPGGLSDWTVANESKRRNLNNTGGWSTAAGTGNPKLKIVVKGYAKTSTTPPKPQSAQIVTGTPDTVQITFDKDLDTNSVPAIGNFQAKFSWSAGFGPKSVTISGKTVSLDMGISPLNPTLEWIKYFKPFNNPLKGTDGAQVAAFTFPEQTTTNPPSTTPPVFTSPSGDDGRRVAPGPWISPRPNRVDLSGTTVIVSMRKAVLLDDANYTTAQLADKFTVWVNGDRQAIVGATVSGYQVTLDLGSSFSAPPGARVAVNYARGPLLDAAAPENRVGGFSYSPGPWASPRPNRVDATATGVVVSMDRAVLLDSNYSDSEQAGAFTVRVNGTAYKPTGVTVSGRDIRLEIGHPVADGDKLDVDYTKGPLQDSTGMPVGGFNYAGVGR